MQAGEAYLWDGKHKQAAAQFQAVYDLDSADYNTLLNIVVTYIRCERVDDAVRFCEQNLAAQAATPAYDEPIAALHTLIVGDEAEGATPADDTDETAGQ